MALFLKNCRYLNWKNFQVDVTQIRVHEGDKANLEFDAQPQPGDLEIDCSGKLVTKSFACGHHHVYSALARGMPAPPRIPGNFLEILELIWWRLDKKLDLEMIEASALVTALDCAKNGVSFVIDHHSSPFAITGSLETIARAFDRVGVSHLLCLELSDRDGPKAARQGLEETGDFIKKRGRGLVGLHASFTVGDPLLKEAVEMAHSLGTGLHVHVAEDKLDQERCLENYGMGVIERFARAGVLDLPATVLAHCLHLSHEERNILDQSAAYIAVNTESNWNNRVGTFQWKARESNIMLGTDGMHSDMLRSAKAAYYAAMAQSPHSPAEAYRRFRNVHNYLEKNRIIGDGDNNLVILDYDSPTPVTRDNFLSHYIYGINSNHVESLICRGELILKNRQPTRVNQQDILDNARENALRLWKQLS